MSSTQSTIGAYPICPVFKRPNLKHTAPLPYNVRYDNKISFYHDVPQILHRLQSAGVIVAACSRTSAPEL